MKIIIAIITTLILLTATAHAQDLHSLLTDEFKGRLVWVTYTDSNGVAKTEPYVTKMGRLKRDYTAPKINTSVFAPGSSFFDIPSVGLAIEHWWLSFELLMKAQRELAACVGAVNEHYTRLGWSCKVDQPCNQNYEPLMADREYWVPSLIVETDLSGKPPRKEDYINHFAAGVFGLNGTVDHVNGCKAHLNWVRGL